LQDEKLSICIHYRITCHCFYSNRKYVQTPNPTQPNPTQPNPTPPNPTQPNPPQPNPIGKVSIEPEFRELHFVKQNEVITASFVLQNTFLSPIQIVQVSKSCSCSEAELSSKVIPAGGQVTMSIVWQTRDRVGPTSVPVQIAYQHQDGTGYQVISCAIRGTVQPKFHVVPQQIVFRDQRTATIQLKAGYEAAPIIRALKSSDPKLQLNFSHDAVTVVVPEGHPIPESGSLFIFAEGSESPVCEVRMSKNPY
jgi:hypothetical protein